MMILANGVPHSNSFPGTELCGSEHHAGSASSEMLNR